MEQNPRTSISAVVALIVAIIALSLSPWPIVNNFAFVLAVIALVLSIIGWVATGKNKKKGRRMAIISLIVALLSCGIVLASQKFYSDTLDKAGKDFNEAADRATGKSTDEILGKEVDVEIGSFQATTGEFGVVETTLPIKVTNKLKESKSYSIQIEAVDESGQRIAEDTAYANNLTANQSQEFKLFQFVQSDQVEKLKKAKFKVLSVSQN